MTLLLWWIFLSLILVFFLTCFLTQISDILRNQTSVGRRHRDHAVTGNVVGDIGSALTKYFFGKDASKKLTVHQFTEFQQELQREVLKLEVRPCHHQASGVNHMNTSIHKVMVSFNRWIVIIVFSDFKEPWKEFSLAVILCKSNFKTL